MEKIAFITGANRGIGFETAKKLGESGIKVILGCRDVVKGEKAVEELLSNGLEVEFIQYNAFDLEAPKKVYDYINDKDEFTVNAGLIIDRKPAAGLIYAPAKKRMFFSYGANLAFELTNNKIIKLNSSKNFDEREIKFVTYSHNIKPEINSIHKKFKVKKAILMKSSLKFCVIAAGEYDGYVAEPRACEWDIAAGHAILKHAGGEVTDFDGNEILYGKKDFKNPSLILKSKSIL